MADALCRHHRRELRNVNSFGDPQGVGIAYEQGLALAFSCSDWRSKVSLMTLKDICAVETTANTWSSDLQSVLTKTSRLFELLTTTLAVMKDRVSARRKAGSLHFSESGVLSRSQVTSSISSPQDAANIVMANTLMEQRFSAHARNGVRTDSLGAMKDNHTGGCKTEEVREKVLNGLNHFGDYVLIHSATYGDMQDKPTDVPSSGLRESDSTFVSSVNDTIYGRQVPELGLKWTDEGHVPKNEPSSMPLDTVRGWNVRANPAITGSTNPIRRITDSLVLNQENGKELISLALGDPSQFGPHMKVPDVVNSAMIEVVRDGKSNGYARSSGLLETRRAVADFLSSGLDHRFTPDDVTLTSGCSQAVQHSIDVLRFDRCNILVPRPGFPLYETLCSYFGVECRHYDLLQDRAWEVDLSQVADLADRNTAAIIICNPGNPCGTVYDDQHLSEIAALAETLRVPIIADEVYSGLVFGRRPFIPMARFSTRAPVLTVGGVSKNWLIPGWRLGWLAISDPHGILRRARVYEALTKIMQITLGPCTLVQAALPKLLVRGTRASVSEEILHSLSLGAELCLRRIEKIDGLACPTKPQGSMFMMVQISPSSFQRLRNDMEFSTSLLNEESVLVLPGSAFGRPNWFRIVFGLSLSQLDKAWDRIEDFCHRHSRP